MYFEVDVEEDETGRGSPYSKLQNIKNKTYHWILVQIVI